MSYSDFFKQKVLDIIFISAILCSHISVFAAIVMYAILLASTVIVIVAASNPKIIDMVQPYTKLQFFITYLLAGSAFVSFVYTKLYFEAVVFAILYISAFIITKKWKRDGDK